MMESHWRYVEVGDRYVEDGSTEAKYRTLGMSLEKVLHFSYGIGESIAISLNHREDNFTER